MLRLVLLLSLGLAVTVALVSLISGNYQARRQVQMLLKLCLLGAALTFLWHVAVRIQSFWQG